MKAKIFGAALVLVSIFVSSAHAVEVSGDREASGYVARGGIVLDSTFEGAAGVRAASPVCPECQWRTSGMCHISSPTEEVGFCGGIAASCPSGRWMVKVWRKIADAPWEYMGVWCVGDRGFVTPESVNVSVKAEAWTFLPALRLGVQPPNPVPTNVPVLVWASQPQVFGPVDLSLDFAEVTLKAAARWQWHFSPSHQLTTYDPGAPWPEGKVRHTFRHSGIREIRVTSHWTAYWQVAGGPWVPVSEELTQTDSKIVNVRPARALLKAASAP